MQILIAEDEAIARIVALYTVGLLGHQGLAVHDGYEALEALRRIRGSGAPWASVPVVAVTGRAALDDLLNAGMDGYVAKPYDMDVSADVIGRHGGDRTGAVRLRPASSVWRRLGEMLDTSGSGAACADPVGS